MSTISKERAELKAFITGFLTDPMHDDKSSSSLTAEVFRIALASLEAEPVGEVSEQRDGLVMDGTVDLGGASTHRIIKGASKMKRLPLGTKFYAAPPAPVSVPDGYRLQPISEYDAMCAAMLQGKADVSLTHEGNNHHEDKLGMVDHSGDANEKVNIPVAPVTQFKPVADLYGLTSPTGSETSFTFDAVEARDFVGGGWSCQEYVELERFQEAVSGNSPVIPDWQTKAEKLAELHGSSFVVFRNGGHPQCADPSKVIISFTDEGLGHGAAAPQQEVK